MKYHIVMSRPFDLEAIASETQAGKRPKHLIRAIGQRLEATIYQPGNDPISLLDKLRAKIGGSPQHWALARALSSQLTPDDFIYCTGEDGGVPIATLCGGKPDRPKIAVFIHNIDRPRGRLTLKLFLLADRIDLFVINNQQQAEYLGVKDDQVFIIPEQTDMACHRPVIVTRLPGAIADLIDAGVATGVNPSDPDDLKAKIVHLLNNPSVAEAQAQRGYERVLKQHASQHYLETLVMEIQKISY